MELFVSSSSFRKEKFESTLVGYALTAVLLDLWARDIQVFMPFGLAILI